MAQATAPILDSTEATVLGSEKELFARAERGLNRLH
jgi:hypothetical protein